VAIAEWLAAVLRGQRALCMPPLLLLAVLILMLKRLKLARQLVFGMALIL
jgi:hypothetical protein